MMKKYKAAVSIGIPFAYGQLFFEPMLGCVACKFACDCCMPDTGFVQALDGGEPVSDHGVVQLELVEEVPALQQVPAKRLRVADAGAFATQNGLAWSIRVLSSIMEEKDECRSLRNRQPTTADSS